MLINHVLGLMLAPAQQWPQIKQEHKSVTDCYRELILILALLPPFAGFYGTTQIGWQIGWEQPVRLTVESALPIAVAYYLMILVAVFLVGRAIHWMAVTYGAEPTLAECVKLAGFTAAPLLLIGILQCYPVLWLNFLVGLGALALSLHLLYSGVPVIMGISRERGFLFSSAVVTFGLVALVAMLTLTALLWGFGLAPEFVQS